MDETQLKQIGTWLVLVLGALGAPFVEGINNLNLSIGWIAFLTSIWYVSDYIVAVIIFVYFKVKKEGVSWKIRTLKIGIGIGLLVIIAAFGLLLIEWIVSLGFTVLWTTALGIAYYGTETLITMLVIHYFKIPIDVLPEEILEESTSSEFIDSNDTDASVVNVPTLEEVDPETLNPV